MNDSFIAFLFILSCIYQLNIKYPSFGNNNIELLLYGKLILVK